VDRNPGRGDWPRSRSCACGPAGRFFSAHQHGETAAIDDGHVVDRQGHNVGAPQRGAKTEQQHGALREVEGELLRVTGERPVPGLVAPGDVAAPGGALGAAGAGSARLCRAGGRAVSQGVEREDWGGQGAFGEAQG